MSHPALALIYSMALGSASSFPLYFIQLVHVSSPEQQQEPGLNPLPSSSTYSQSDPPKTTLNVSELWKGSQGHQGVKAPHLTL